MTCKFAAGVLAIAFPVVAAHADAQVVEYYHLDAIGTVRAVTDASGQLVERHDTLPFGEEWCTTSICTTVPAGQPRRFAGKERDTETGNDYFGARYYGSRIGRFTTIDPLAGQPDALVNTQRWNRYAYGRNNPLTNVDPDGRRDVNRHDRARFRALRAEAQGHPEVAPNVEGAIKDIKAVIHAVPADTDDPAALASTYFAIDNLGNADYGLDGTVGNGQTETVGPGDWKCNIFVANAYAVGAGVGFDGSGVPTRTTLLGLGHRYPPVANAWADPGASIANFPVAAGPSVGSVVAFPHPGGLGHSAISIGGGLVIYAGPRDVKANTISQTQSGVNASSVTYRDYKP